MPLIKDTLKAQLLAVFLKENTPDEAADQIATAIDSYIKTATITIVPGIPVATAGTAAAQTGATTGPGTGSIS